MISKKQFIFRITLLWLICFGINIIYLATVNIFMGIGSSIFVDPSDRFADYIKASLSLKSLLINSSGSLNYSEWPQIFIGYLQNNPYLEYPLSSPGLTIFHHPPLTFNYFQSTAILLSYGFTPYELIIFNLLTLLCLFIVILRICFI